MTIRGLGRAMPVHIFMVQLAGMRVTPAGGPVVPKDDAQMAEVMRVAREELRRHYGADFGTDLAAWRAWLMSPEGAHVGYTHPYSFQTVDRIIVAAIDDPRRQRIAELLAREHGT